MSNERSDRMDDERKPLDPTPKLATYGCVSKEERHWDPEGRYGAFDLRRYRFWLLAVSTRQHTPGSCIIFCLRPGVWKFSELTDREVGELILVHQQVEFALDSCAEFKPNHVNYCQYGNELRMLHEHVVPRYKTSRSLRDKIWCDPCPGGLPPWTSQDNDPSIVHVVHQLLFAHLPPPPPIRSARGVIDWC